MPTIYLLPLAVFLRVTAGAEKQTSVGADEDAHAPPACGNAPEEQARHLAARLLFSRKAKLGPARALRLH